MHATPQTASMPLAYGIAATTADTYPMHAPYRNTNTTPVWSARTPRILMLTLSTLANTVNDAWDEPTRTLTFRPCLFELRKALGLSDTGPGRAAFRRDLNHLIDHGYPTRHDSIPAVQCFDMPGRTLRNATLTFTEPFTRMLTHRPRFVHVDAIRATVNRTAMLLDILMLGVLYCPEGKRLLVPLWQLGSLLPATSRTTLGVKHVSVLVDEFNTVQDEWRARITDSLMELKPNGMGNAPAVRLTSTFDE